jgi:glutamine deamidase
VIFIKNMIYQYNSQLNSFHQLDQPLFDAMSNFDGQGLKILSGPGELAQEAQKIDSVSSLFFETCEPALKETNNLDKGFNFITEIETVTKEFAIEEQDRELASRFCKIVNPNRIPDGHCASCAFNTHLHLIGHTLEKAKDPDCDFKVFGDWFYRKVCKRFDDNTIESNPQETYGSFKTRVEQRINEYINPDEAVLISISEGAHWYNAILYGHRVWFIDSQTGKGFNLYTNNPMQPQDIIQESIFISLIKITQADIEDYQRIEKNKRDHK